MSTAVHTATLPWLPQGQPPVYHCPSAPRLPQSPCMMALGTELQLVLSLQAPGLPGYEQDGAQAPFVAVSRLLVRKRRRKLQAVLPAAWLLPDFSPGLWGETFLGPGTKRKESGSTRAGQPSLGSWSCVPGLGLPQALLHLPLLPGHLFAYLWPVWGKVQVPAGDPCSATRQGRSSSLLPCRLWGDSTCREKFPKAVAVSCLRSRLGLKLC